MYIDYAIEILKDDNRDICYGTSLTNEAINMAIDALERTRWISVSERLPTEKDADIDGDIWVWNEYRKCFYTERYDFACEYSYWMPLPKPPEVE